MRVLADDGPSLQHKGGCRGSAPGPQGSSMGSPSRDHHLASQGGINFNPAILAHLRVIYLICKPKFRLAPKANALRTCGSSQERENEHPAPFVELASSVLIEGPESSSTPFHGSGTTAIAARCWQGGGSGSTFAILPMAESDWLGEECDLGDVGGGVLPSSTWCDVASLPVPAYNPPTPMPGPDSATM